MKKLSIFPGCTAALLLCVLQLTAQMPRHTGAQAFDPPRKWHGLDLKLFFGTFNTATGTQALNSCTSCTENVADGYQALSNCTTCANNVGVGFLAINGNVTGANNIGIGTAALEFEVFSDNIGIGSGALEGGGPQGTGGIGIGSGALQKGENYSVAVGFQSMLYSGSPTGYNTAVGAYALAGNGKYYNPAGNQGSNNVALGAYSLFVDSTGNDNVAVGYQALYSNSSGGFNNASGLISLYNNTSGTGNVGDGLGTLFGNTTGTGNTGIGMEAMTSNTTGMDNTGLGYGANVGSGSLTNATAIGANAVVSSSNQVIVGNTAVTSIGGAVNFTKISDGRYKKNIQQNVPGLVFINKLVPITYTLDVAGMETKLHRSMPSLPAGIGKNADDDPIMKQARQEKAAVIETGFVAQDVEKAAASVNYVFSGVDKPKNADESFYGLRYADFVPPLVKAVQELSAASDSKDSVINSLQTQINELRAMVLAQKSAATSGASLEQNAPNPFTGSTVIGYNLPPGASSAQLQITDASGKVLALIPLAGSGRSSVTANVAGYAAGTYQYSLIVDGKLVSTKQMISVR